MNKMVNEELNIIKLREGLSLLEITIIKLQEAGYNTRNLYIAKENIKEHISIAPLSKLDSMVNEMDKTYSKRYKENIVKREKLFNGNQTIYKFNNGFGASIINHDFSYGVEVAILSFDKGSPSIFCIQESIVDVIPYVKDIDAILEKIESLGEYINK